jgi:RHS repeat-associated protein
MKSPVVESQNFYPFGALSQSYSRENSLENNRLYQGKEYQKDLSLNLYDFEWRQYDPWSVRTTTMDPHAEMFYPLSPYSWAGNNPLLFVDPDGRTIVGVNYTEDDKGQHYDLSNASEDTKKMLWSMLQTNEGQQQASFLGSTETEVTMQLTDQLILDGAGDGSGFGLAASIISDGTMSSKNPKVYDKATLLVSTFSKKTEDINQQDIDNAYIITDDYYGNNNGSIKSITPSSKLPKDIQAWLTTLDGLQTGSMYGEINANATHEANHLRAENIGLSPKRKETDAKHGSFPVEERTRRQWLQKFGPNSSVAPPQNINNLSDN